MGIKKLFTILNNNNLYKTYPYLNDLIKDLNIDKKYLIIGVDANLFCYKYIHSYDNMLIGFFNQILKFISNKIIPLYIFDGGTIPEKENTNILRNHKKIISRYKLEQIENLLITDTKLENKDKILLLKKKLEKNSIKINTKTILLLLELFNLLNVPYIFAHGEGEYLAVLLNKYNIIDMFLSDDTDPILGGINKIIKFYNNNVYYLDTDTIYDKLSLNKDEFCDYCILLGSDYFIISHGLKPLELLEIIKKYNSIENIFKNNIIPCLTIDIFVMINKIRYIYRNSYLIEKNLILGNNFDKQIDINLLIDHNNLLFYSDIMLELWDDFIKILSLNCQDKILEYGSAYKNKIINLISTKKFKINNILKYIKNNISDITNDEINSIKSSLIFLNTV
jgi:hypothetical protein